jgi:hypothetical protein
MEREDIWIDLHKGVPPYYMGYGYDVEIGDGADLHIIEEMHDVERGSVDRIAIFFAGCKGSGGMDIAVTYQPRSWSNKRFASRVRVFGGKKDR